MHSSRRYREQIDASRPGSADLRLPELADLAKALESDAQLAAQLDRAHENDIALHQALHVVEHPIGLNDRLLSQLFAAPASVAEVIPDRTRSSADSQEIGLPAAAAGVALPPQVRHSSRRKWVSVALATAAVTLLAVSAAVWKSGQPQERSKEQLSSNVAGWLEQTRSLNGWKSETAATLADYPIDTAVRAKPLRWKPLTTSTRDRGVIYDLTPPGRQRATLFVIQTNDRYPVRGTPYTTMQATGGQQIGAWQSGGLLYVLAVDRDGQRLENFLDARPLTMQPKRVRSIASL